MDKKMSKEIKDYDYAKEKKGILDLLKSCEKEMIILKDKLNYFIKASKDLGIPYIYLLIGLKSPKSKTNIVGFLFSLYFENIEMEKLEELFFLIFDAFFYECPDKYSITNPIEKDFLINIGKMDLMEEYTNESPRQNGNLIENIYFKIASTIELYDSYIVTTDNSEDDINKIISQYEDCKKEIKNLKNNKDILHLKYNLDFFNDLLKKVKLNKLDKKNENDINNNNINDEDEDGDDGNNDLSMSRSFSQHLEKMPLKERTFFILNETVNYGEDEEIVIKNYKFFKEKEEIFSNNCGEKIKKLICGLLNNKGGRIFFGINDENNENIVKGNKLSYKQRDELRLELLNLTTYFYPECKSSKISVHFMPIKDEDNNFLDRYVTKIIVKQGDTEKLYSISDKKYESYKRIEGKNNQIKAKGIASEIYKRKKNPEKPLPDDEFIDPEPEKNFYEKHSKNSNEREHHHNDNNNRNNYYENQKTKKKYNNRNRNNKENIKIIVKNIDKEAPIFLLKDIFQEYKDLIVDSKFF